MKSAKAKVIAVYTMKGGVGKTTLAVNLAWYAAQHSQRGALLWDLDGQAAATYMLGRHGTPGHAVDAVIRQRVEPTDAPVATDWPGLSLIPADASLHSLDVEFHDLDKKKRLAKAVAAIGQGFDYVIIDCPPGLSQTAEQVLRAADLVVMPVLPSKLAGRALDAVVLHMADHRRLATDLLPVFSMVDRRRTRHREALAAHPDWPVIPMASAIEAMADRCAPLATYAPASSPGVKAMAGVWDAVRARLGA